jgi:hypothetical protein
MSETYPASGIRLVLLTLGALTGLLVAAFGLVETGPSITGSLPENVIARVGEHIILKERYLQLLNDLATDKRTPLSADDRQFAVDRLIDEELLIMRGIELGLHETSPEIRKTIAATLIAQIATEAEATVPGEAALRRLYETDSNYFSTFARFRLRWWQIHGFGVEVERKAKKAHEQLSAGLDVELAMAASGLQADPYLPNQLLPMSKLSDYIGPVLAQEASSVRAGEFSNPIAAQGGFHIFHMLARQESLLPPFEQVRPMVEAEYSRRLGEDALREYLSWLRERTEITINPEKFQ